MRGSTHGVSHASLPLHRHLLSLLNTPATTRTQLLPGPRNSHWDRHILLPSFTLYSTVQSEYLEERHKTGRVGVPKYLGLPNTKIEVVSCFGTIRGLFWPGCLKAATLDSSSHRIAPYHIPSYRIGLLLPLFVHSLFPLRSPVEDFRTFTVTPLLGN